MKFNLKLFVLVGVLAGFRDVCGTEENKDYDGFIVAELAGNENEEKKALTAAIDGNRVIKAVYQTEVGGIVDLINSNFQNKLSYILVWDGKEVKKVIDEDFIVRDYTICYNMSKDVEYTVYFIFNDELLNSTAKMFFMCTSLISADFRCFNTSNVTDMSYMFSGCSSLKELNLSKFNTSNVTDMFNMFYGCSSLTTLDLSKFNTEKVIDMSYMFSGCSSLKTVFLPSKGVKIKKRCICCGDEYVRWNNHEVGGLNPKIVKSNEEPK